MCLAILGHYALKGPDYIQFKNVYFRRLEQIYLRFIQNYLASLRYYKKIFQSDGILDGVFNGNSSVIICS